MAEASNRNAVVTGAAGGMGRAIAKALVESGRRVVLADRDPASLREFAAEMGDKTFPIELDITDAKAVDRLPDLIPDTFKPIDILVKCRPRHRRPDALRCRRGGRLVRDHPDQFDRPDAGDSQPPA
ncbi:NAD(P)-dependent dehydrogenase (short-subunit alcohol dehydrogenase family) [Bradyrhizobium sp. AZCC 1693]